MRKTNVMSSIASDTKKTAIKSIIQLKKIQRCRELTINRNKLHFQYTHHVFVGEKYDDGCDLYHYCMEIKAAVFCKFPVKIKKVKLIFENYLKCTEILEIFNVYQDEVSIVNRDDYPKNKEDEEKCIKRAESRVGEMMYSAVDNNCECFVNWIFSSANTSKQIEESFVEKVVGGGADGLLSSGIGRPTIHTASGIIYHFQTSDKSSEKASNITDEESTCTKLQKKIPEIEQNISRWTKASVAKEVCNKVVRKSLAKKTKDESIKKMSNEAIKRSALPVSALATGFSVVSEVGLTCKHVIDIYSNEYMTREQKAKSASREIVTSTYGITGSVLGQVLIPVPVVGSLVGGVVGNVLGSVIYEVMDFTVNHI